MPGRADKPTAARRRRLRPDPVAGSATLSPAAIKRLWDIGQWARRAPCTHKFDRAVLREIADHADWKSCEAFPSVDTIAAATLLERKTVIASVNRMLQQGLLEDTGRKAGRLNRQRIYRLPVSKCDNGTSGGPMNGTSDGPIMVRFLPPLNGTSGGPKPSKEQPAVTDPPCSASGKGGPKADPSAGASDFISFMHARQAAMPMPQRRTRKRRGKAKATGEQPTASVAASAAPPPAVDDND